MHRRRVQAHRASLLLIAAAGLCLSGCGEPQGRSDTSSHVFMSFDGLGGGMDLEVDGIQLDIDESVRFEYRRQSSTGREAVTEMSIDGWPFSIDGTTLRIGEHHFEGVQPGDRVVFSKTGISVNGERRWDFPVE